MASQALSRELLDIAEKAALAAGEFLMNRPTNFELNIKSSAVDFATQMDHASEAMIIASLLETRPDDGIIGEEGGARTTRSGITWVIDPLDGTVNYFYGLPGWNISIAAKDDEGVVIGVVYSPTTNSLWKAMREGGASLNDRPIHVSNASRLDQSLIATGFSYDQDKRTAQGEQVARLAGKVRDLRRFGAAAVDLCFVAMGAVDGYYESGLNEWDLAAGGLIAREAGAIVSGLPDGSGVLTAASREMVIAAGPTLHPVLASEISPL